MDHDFEVQNGGSIFLLIPCSDAARTWVEEHIPADVLVPRWAGSGCRSTRSPA